MTDSKLIKKVLGELLVDEGFKKKSDTWYLSSDEIVLLVNLQKSQYGEQYYVNCGIALKSLGIVEFPKENLCHIRFRLTAVVSEEERKNIESVFDLENDSLSDQERSSEILRLIQNIALPILKKCLSMEGMVETIKSGKLAKAMIHKQIKELLG